MLVDCLISLLDSGICHIVLADPQQRVELIGHRPQLLGLFLGQCHDILRIDCGSIGSPRMRVNQPYRMPRSLEAGVAKWHVHIMIMVATERYP